MQLHPMVNFKHTIALNVIFETSTRSPLYVCACVCVYRCVRACIGCYLVVVVRRVAHVARQVRPTALRVGRVRHVDRAQLHRVSHALLLLKHTLYSLLLHLP